VIALAVGTLHDAFQHRRQIQRPGDLRRDLDIVVLVEQAYRHRQIRDHVRWQFPFGPDPAQLRGIGSRSCSINWPVTCWTYTGDAEARRIPAKHRIHPPPHRAAN
jgi:hypothetical protein